ncbi:MAG: exodeoxyribonuclease VII small subunit [Bacteroidales bacterium]|jgi:exodeoxyribonuclease VII small subunit|nr:exodeoxyribonuclease VII small subunit [Bacteroidales bacterium]
MKTNEYEDAVAKLEALLKKIEDPDTSLSEIAGDVKEARNLIGKCKSMLHATQNELEKSFAKVEDGKEVNDE